MPIAINGNVNGTQIWIPDHHWWDYPSLWPLPKRPEDGQLDWERLFPHQRDVVRRFSSILRTLWGLPPTLPPVPYQPFGTPSPQGWVMPLDMGSRIFLKIGKMSCGSFIESHHPVRGTGTFALLVDCGGGNPWFVLRADGHPWHDNPCANHTRAASIWVNVLAWQSTTKRVLPDSTIDIAPLTIPGRARTVYGERYPDEPTLYGALDSLPAPVEERIEVQDVPVWWKGLHNQLWKHFLRPDPQKPERFPYGANSIDEENAFQCITQYGHLVRKWTEPYEPDPRLAARFEEQD